MNNTYATLVEVGADTQLLCFVYAPSLDKARDITEENVSTQYPGREYRINLFAAQCMSGDNFEIVNVNIQG